MKAGTRPLPATAKPLQTFFDFEAVSDASDYVFDARTTENENDGSMGVEWLGQPEIQPFLYERATGRQIAVNIDKSFDIGKATSGSGFISGYVMGPNHQQDRQLAIAYESIAGANEISFTASMGFVFYSDPARYVDWMQHTKVVLTVHHPGGPVFYSKEISRDLLTSGCSQGGNFVLEPPFVIAGKYALARCGPMRFNIRLNPSQQSPGQPLVAVWHLSTDREFDSNVLTPLFRFNIDEVKSEYSDAIPEPYCSAYRSSDNPSAQCIALSGNPAHFLRVTDPGGVEKIYQANNNDPMIGVRIFNDVYNKSGIFTFDAVCLGWRQNGEMLSCGRSAKEARFWAEPIRPKPVVARLTANEGVLFPPPDSCYTAGAISYDIFSGQGKIATVDAGTFERDGYLLTGLKRNGDSDVFYVYPNFAEGGTRLKSGIAVTTWHPQNFSFVVDHFPVENHPATILVKGSLSRTNEYSGLWMISAERSDPGRSVLGFADILSSPPFLYFQMLGGAKVPGGKVPEINARVALIDSTRSDSKQEEIEGFDGRRPTHSFWILSSDLTDGLTVTQLQRALRYFGDPQAIEGNHMQCLHEKTQIPPLLPSALSPTSINLCECAFSGSKFNCNAKTPGHALLVTLPTPEASLARALTDFYLRNKTVVRRVGGRTISTVVKDGLLADPKWRSWVTWRQNGPTPVYPQTVEGVDATAEDANGLATYDYLRMVAWDREPGNNLFRSGSSFFDQWLTAYNQLFFARYVLASDLAPDLIKPDYGYLVMKASRLLFSLDDTYAWVHDQPTSMLDHVASEAMAAWMRLQPVKDSYGIEALSNDGLKRWPGDVLPGDCGGLCSPSELAAFPKCDNYDDYRKKLDGYLLNGTEVSGYIEAYRNSEHYRNEAGMALKDIVHDLHSREHIIFGAVGDAVALRVINMPSGVERAWRDAVHPGLVPMPEEVRDAQLIVLSNNYCRGKSPDLSAVISHEAAHVHHALHILFHPQTLRAAEAVSQETVAAPIKQEELDRLFGSFRMWTEYRAYRFEYCSKKEDYQPGGICADERAFFDAVFFGKKPPGWRLSSIPDGLVWRKQRYLNLWEAYHLCRGKDGACNSIDDIAVPLPIGDLCNPFTGERGNCPALP